MTALLDQNLYRLVLESLPVGVCVVITMGASGGPPEEIGHKVAAALVGTLLGICFVTDLLDLSRPTWRKIPKTSTRFTTFCAWSSSASLKVRRPALRWNLDDAPFPATCAPASKKWKSI
jgi:chemotaxis protein MotA